ncbi:uncharacterized protein [Apostichopus japonicus]|uniref:uncharacterized protein n=1 Tax=Stichopus japonicus TaxID=307972 RepID=UPI003AB7FEE5
MSRKNTYGSRLPEFLNDEELQTFLDEHLTEACSNGDIDQVIDLLQKGASVEGDAWIQSQLLDGENFMTPLMSASMNGHHKIVKLLLGNDAEPNKGDRYNVTPLHCAALSGHEHCIELLIRAGSNVRAATLNYNRIGVHQKPHRAGTTSLHLAARQNHPGCIKRLLEDGKADINQANVLGLTALNIACQNGHEESILTLINFGKEGCLSHVASQVSADTTLHHCVRHGLVQATRELLKYGMDPNKRNAAGYTPLHFAVVQNCVPHADMIRVLIENGRGIDVNAAIGDELAGIRNRAGRKGAGLRALHLVAFSPPEVSHSHELHTMEYHLSTEFVTNADPNTPIRDVNSASLLIQYGADTSVCYKGRTLMQQEIYNQSGTDLLELLIRSELRVDIPDRPDGISDEQFKVSDAERKINWLKGLSRIAPSLQQCCRIKIREFVTPLRLNRIHELPVPSKLKDYILLKY